VRYAAKSEKKTGLQLELALLIGINQKTFSFICSAVSATKATSKPDQAATIVEFTKLIHRLRLDTEFPEMYRLVWPTLDAGWEADWIANRRELSNLGSYIGDHGDAASLVVPLAALRVLIAAGKEASEHPDEIAQVFGSGRFGKKLYGKLTLAALAHHLKQFMNTRVGMLLDTPAVGHPEVMDCRKQIMMEVNNTGANKLLCGQLGFTVTLGGVNMGFEVATLQAQADVLIGKGIRETAVFSETNGIERTEVEKVYCLQPPPPRDVPTFDPEVLESIQNSRKAMADVIASHPSLTGEDLHVKMQENLANFILKDRNARLDFLLYQAYLTTDFGTKAWYEKALAMFPSASKHLEYKVVYESFTVMGTREFRQLANGTVRAVYNEVLGILKALASGQAPRDMEVWRSSTFMTALSQRCQFFVLPKVIDGRTIVGIDALRKQLQEYVETSPNDGPVTRADLADLTALRHLLTADEEEARGALMKKAYEAEVKRCGPGTLVPVTTSADMVTDDPFARSGPPSMHAGSSTVGIFGVHR